MKKIIKKYINLLPENYANNISNLIISLKNLFFINQRKQIFKSGDYFLSAPISHVYFDTCKSQPLRDKFIGIVAKFFGEKYKDSSFIDIGANIGDTAALMASNASNKLILVDVDNYFFSFLEKNVKQFKNEIELKKYFISNGEVFKHRIIYEGGTAVVKEGNFNSKNKPKSKLIENISNDKISFLKVDIDGYDLKAIQASISWINKQKPALIFEFDGLKSEIIEIDKLLISLFSIEYKFFTIWDDAGYKLISTSNKNEILDLCRYVKNNYVGGNIKRIWDLNILCVSIYDEELFHKINNSYK